jgi:hypothetical protein
MLVAFPLDLSTQQGTRNRGYQRENKQRPQAELIPAELALRRIGFRRLGRHGRIIRRDVETEQAIKAVGSDSGRIL